MEELEVSFLYNAFTPDRPLRVTTSFGLVFALERRRGRVAKLTPCCRQAFQAPVGVGFESAARYHCPSCSAIYPKAAVERLDLDFGGLVSWVEPYLPTLEAELVASVLEERLRRFQDFLDLIDNHKELHRAARRLSGPLF